MPQPTPRLTKLLLVLVLLAAQLAAAPAPAALTAAAGPIVSAAPLALAVSIPLGQTQTRTITLTNTSNAAVTPAIYEAWPPATGTQARAGAESRPARVMLPQQADRIDAELIADLQTVPGGRADFIIYMRDQADLSAAYTIADWGERGRYVYQTLTVWAASRQSGLRRQLAAQSIIYRPLWIVNAVLAHGTLADAQSLAGRGDVALIRANHAAALPPAARQPAATPAACNADQPTSPICWNIRKVGADRVWRELGVTGQGIVVASIDTGVSYNHPALGPSYRGYRGPGQYDHNYSWFDPLDGSLAPHDDSYHGTHTMGTIAGVGDGSTGQPAIGVAPGARWSSAAGCSAYACTEADLIASAQWILAPTAIDGTRPRPDLRPMVVNNSWSGIGNDQWYAGYTAAWRAAGIFPVFAAGNSFDQQCGSINSPADYPDVMGVGATDKSDTIASFSQLGPTADGRMKPDLSAPGQSVVSATPGTSYRTLSGTSMAAPHVAGAVALIWSANPALIGDYDTTYAILRDTALRRGDTRCGDPPDAPNNVYGQGRLDAFAAVARARVDVPWLIAPAATQPLTAGSSTSLSVTFDAARVQAPGTYAARLQIYGGDLGQPPTSIDITLTVAPIAQQALVGGQVISAEDGAPLSAQVDIRDGARVATDATGAYTLTVAPGIYTLRASAAAFLTAQQTISVTGDMRLPDFALQPDQPRLAIDTAGISMTLAFAERRTIALPIGNNGPQPLHYRVSLPQDRFAVWHSEEPGGPSYQWIDLPASAPKLTLGDNTYTDEIPLDFDFPLFSDSYTETVVTSDGTLAFAEPQQGYSGITSRCLPGFEIPFNMIAPFRADLDPSRGGAVRYGTLPDHKTFVLSYENVPLHSGPISETYTFQTLLHDDGRIVFQYKQLAALPNALSVGIQKNHPPYGEPDHGFQQIACGMHAPLHDGLAIELRPQTSSDVWLTTDSEEGVVVPGGQQIISISLAWQRPTRGAPLRARILVDSSDRTRPSLTLPVQIDMLPAPIERWLGPVFSLR